MDLYLTLIHLGIFIYCSFQSFSLNLPGFSSITQTRQFVLNASESWQTGRIENLVCLNTAWRHKQDTRPLTPAMDNKHCRSLCCWQSHLYEWHICHCCFLPDCCCFLPPHWMQQCCYSCSVLALAQHLGAKGGSSCYKGEWRQTAWLHKSCLSNWVDFYNQLRVLVDKGIVTDTM